MSKLSVTRLTFPHTSDITDWISYVDTNIFPDVDKKNVDPAMSLDLDIVGELRYRGNALLTILRHRLENRRRELRISSIETSSQIETDIFQIQLLFNNLRDEINQMPLFRTWRDIVKISNNRMLPSSKG